MTSSQNDSRSSNEELSILDFVNTVLRRRLLVFGMPVGVGLAVALASLFLSPQYTAFTTFVPESPSGGVPAGLSGLATQLGIGGAAGGRTSQFYAEVLKGREIGDRVLMTRFPDPRPESGPNDSTPLIVLLDADGDTPKDSLLAGRRAIARAVGVTVTRQTGILRLSVETAYPELSAQVANRLLHLLNEFNTEARQSQVRMRRAFVADRLSSAEIELRKAEDDRRTFLQQNRQWQQAPLLALEEDRLRREVQLRQEIFLTLSREYETARIEEVNDTPVLSVIDHAVAPLEKSSPMRRLMVLLAVTVSGVLAIVIAFTFEFLERTRVASSAAGVEFRRLLDEVRRTLTPRGWRQRTAHRRHSPDE